MKMNKGMFSSERGDWATPQEFFDKLNNEFAFTMDVCADKSNHKCEKYFNKADDGLSRDWHDYACWMNPPYGDEISAWVEKASKVECLVVGLLPARTDTRWFHDHVYGKAELRFVKGRIKFVGGKSSAPFPSMIAIWRPKP